ncbi:DUF177 domain-containing protein [candidate division WOR-3 bacterium]|nr:DUF177 domain-containing protein [candidate division WOR-3 bacterium]
MKLRKSALGIGADFTVVYQSEATCMRCLRAFPQEKRVELRLDYVPGEDPFCHAENIVLTPHDADRVYYRSPHIDLSIGIREAVVLSTPITQVCKDDCPGLCPVCGADLNKGRCSCAAAESGPFSSRKNLAGNVNVASRKWPKARKK